MLFLGFKFDNQKDEDFEIPISVDSCSGCECVTKQCLKYHKNNRSQGDECCKKCTAVTKGNKSKRKKSIKKKSVKKQISKPKAPKKVRHVEAPKQ